MVDLRYSDQDLAKTLGCSPKRIKDLTGRNKIIFSYPSFRLLSHLAIFVYSNPDVKPSWSPALVYSKEFDDSFPIDKIKILPTRCVECVHELDEGIRKEKDIWWVKNPRSKFCTPAHKAKYWKREGRYKNEANRYSRAEVKFDNLFYGKTPAAAESESSPSDSSEKINNDGCGEKL
jgi:hypothetical protein